MAIEQAATLLGVIALHTRRILAVYRRDGAAAIAQGIGTTAEAVKRRLEGGTGAQGGQEQFEQDGQSFSQFMRYLAISINAGFDVGRRKTIEWKALANAAR